MRPASQGDLICPFRSLSLAMLVMLWRPKNWSNKTPLLQVASSQNDNNVTIFRNIDGDNLTARKIKEQLPSVQIHGREDGLHVKHFYLNVAPIVLVRITAVYDMSFHRWEFIIQHACNLSRKKKKGARPDWTWLLSVCTRRLRSHIVLPKRKKMAVARHPLKNWTQFSCKYCLSFFHPINMTACHVSKNHPLFKRIELCNLLYFKAKLQKVRDLLGRQNNRLKCCKQQKKLTLTPYRFWL